MKTKNVQLADMIAWAKDRCLDDLRDFMHTECGRFSYAMLSEEKRAEVMRMTRLLSMPDDSPETLAALSYSYWNGKDDTFWEDHERLDGYVGFTLNVGQQ